MDPEEKEQNVNIIEYLIQNKLNISARVRKDFYE